MGVKVDVFTDVFETFATIAVDLSPVFGKNIPFRMFTHSNQVFYIMTRGKLPMEKLLSIDIAAAREAYQKSYIGRLGLVRGEHNLADAASQLKNNGRLIDILYSGVNDTPVEQWMMLNASDHSETMDYAKCVCNYRTLKRTLKR